MERCVECGTICPTCDDRPIKKTGSNSALSGGLSCPECETKDHEIAFLYRTLEKLANETLEVNKDGSFYGSTTAVDVNKALGLWAT